MRVLQDLSGAAPEKLWLLEFTDAAGAATLTGLALDNQTIASFMRQLQTSKYFHEVDLVETSQSDANRGPAGFKRFIIKAHLDYMGAAAAPKAAAAPGTAPAARTGT